MWFNGGDIRFGDGGSGNIVPSWPQYDALNTLNANCFSSLSISSMTVNEDTMQDPLNRSCGINMP